MSEIKVCHLLSTLNPGGAEKMTLRLVKNSSEDVTHHVCYFQGKRKQAHHLRDDFETAGATVHYCHSYTLYDPRGLLDLFSVFKEEEFDVVHNHVILTHPIGRVVGKVAGVGSVISTHDGVIEKYRPHFRLLEYLTRGLDDITVAYSEGVTESLPDEWEVVHNGIDVAAFRERVNEITDDVVRQVRADLNVTEDDTLFLNVSRYVEQKSQETAIRAFQQVCEQQSDVHLVLVGYGPLETELRQLAEELGISEHVTVTGRVDRVAPYYAAADAFVLTYAPYIRDWGIVSLEAMAASLPIVATRTANMNAVVSDGENGFLADSGNYSEMADGMIALCDESRREKMGEVGFRRVAEEFDIERTVREYEELYSRRF